MTMTKRRSGLKPKKINEDSHLCEYSTTFTSKPTRHDQKKLYYSQNVNLRINIYGHVGQAAACFI